VASLSQGRTAAAQCGLFTYKSVPVIFEPPCICKGKLPRAGGQAVFSNYCVYLLTPLSRVLLEKLTGSKLVKKFPAFYGTRRFITAFTNARHLSLS